MLPMNTVRTTRSNVVRRRGGGRNGGGGGRNTQGIGGGGRNGGGGWIVRRACTGFMPSYYIGKRSIVKLSIAIRITHARKPWGPRYSCPDPRVLEAVHVARLTRGDRSNSPPSSRCSWWGPIRSRSGHMPRCRSDDWMSPVSEVPLVTGVDLIEARASAGDDRFRQLPGHWVQFLGGRRESGDDSIDVLPDSVNVTEDGTVVAIDDDWTDPGLSRSDLVKRADLVCAPLPASHTSPSRWSGDRVRAVAAYFVQSVDSAAMHGSGTPSSSRRASTARSVFALRLDDP